MNRYSLIDNVTNWGDQVVWCKEHLGEAQAWGGLVLEPTRLKQPYQWAMGDYRINPKDTESMTWPCFWIPDGPAHTAFILKWR